MIEVSRGFKRDALLCVGAAAVGVGLARLLRHHFVRESPILVRDGSMILETPVGERTLDDHFEPDGNVLFHSKCETMVKMKGISPSGVVKVAHCSGTALARLVVTYEDDSKIIFRTNKDGNGLLVKCKEKPFDGWDTTSSAAKWVKSGSNKIRHAEVEGTDNDGILCAGKKSIVEVTVRS